MNDIDLYKGILDRIVKASRRIREYDDDYYKRNFGTVDDEEKEGESNE